MERNKMLIDATHPEETRVVVLRNGRVEEFDFESAARKLLRGNIYLAKVTRVEPSLQAAFVEYGGNRHGFLAFSEIHPDYYQIPIADREALKQAEAEAEAAAEAEADERARRRSRGRRPRNAERPAGYEDQPYAAGRDGYADRNLRPGIDAETEGSARRAEPLDHERRDDEILREPYSEGANGDRGRRPEDLASHEPEAAGERDREWNGPRVARDHVGGDSDPIDNATYADPSDAPDRDAEAGIGDAADPEQIEEVATEEDALEEVPDRPRRRMRQYKIQEVIKRRQIILVQVVKEERGNKGAALTTYISLAGRYTVLMPNTGRGGGISRKITQAQDRKRLKAIASELEVPEGMGLIIRTAGAARTMQEIRRDYEYLLRLWESVRDLTLASTAPSLVYEEGNLIKRSIRDLYTKDIGEILVAGEATYREAHGFMGMLMPGHADDVVHYRAPEPLFNRFGIERQLNAMFNPIVTLKSGGYIVINQTEALVAVDVNSGRSTREFSIEETALNTNIEAAEEISRQLKLRDLAGLIVVDFIDMEEKRNNRTVERRLKDALRHDRARIQVGRISHFGLLEMSRQRLRTGVVEGSTSQCPHCQGTGTIRSTESIALAVLRGLEEQLMRQPASVLVQTNASVALYILNHKRPFINEMERRFGIGIRVEASERMHGANFAIERTAAPVEQAKVARTAVSMDWGFDGAEAEPQEAERVDREPQREGYRGDRDDELDRDADGDSEGPRRGRRRRRRGQHHDRPEVEGSYDEPRAMARDEDDRSADWRRDEPRREPRYDDRAEPRRGEQRPREERSNNRGARENGDRVRDDRSSRSERPERENNWRRHDESRDSQAVRERADFDEDDRRGRSDDQDRTINGSDGQDSRSEQESRRRRRRGRRGGRSRGRGEARDGSQDAQSWDVVDMAQPDREAVRLRTRDDVVRKPVVETRDADSYRDRNEDRSINDRPRSSIVETADRTEPEPQPMERRPVVETAPPATDYGLADTLPSAAGAQEPRSSRKGWWQRRFGGGD